MVYVDGPQRSVSDHRPTNLPTSDELPCCDDTPVDNVGRRTSRSEDQNFLPNYLLFLLELIWKDRSDWYFAVDMGVYHTTGVSPKVPIVPDGFLSLGVPRRKPGNKSRKSGQYQLQLGEPYWMPEVGLAIGRSQGVVGGLDRETLSWFDQRGQRYLSAEEQAQQAQQQAQRLAARLRELGVDPDTV